MNLYIKNNTFWFELENLTRLFFPNEKITVYKEDFESVSKPFIIAELSDKIEVHVCIGEFYEELSAPLSENDSQNELSTVKLLYKSLSHFSGIAQPWGLLTGVRPIKLLRKQYEERGREEAERIFKADHFAVAPRIVQPVRRNTLLPVAVQLLLVCDVIGRTREKAYRALYAFAVQGA